MAVLWNQTCKLRHPMHFRHPVPKQPCTSEQKPKTSTSLQIKCQNALNIRKKSRTLCTKTALYTYTKTALYIRIDTSPGTNRRRSCLVCENIESQNALYIHQQSRILCTKTALHIYQNSPIHPNKNLTGHSVSNISYVKV